MGSQDSKGSRKKMKLDQDEPGGSIQEGGSEEDRGEEVIGSKEMEMQIQVIVDKMEQFTQQVSELLEAGKAMFQDLCTKFEERLIEIHSGQMLRWQEEIRDLRVLDVSNEETSSLLQNTREHLLQNIHFDSLLGTPVIGSQL